MDDAGSLRITRKTGPVASPRGAELLRARGSERFGVGASCHLKATPAKAWNQGSACG